MSNPTVLIVEDDNDLREAIKTALEADSFVVIEARDGEEGYRAALSHRPDVILLDILMPNKNGHETLDMIRKDAWGKDAKVIFLTSYSDPENIVQAVEKGSEEYIVKSHTSLEDIVKHVRLAAAKR